MTAILIFATIISSLAGLFQVRSDGLEVKYDKFRDETRINVRDEEAINLKNAKQLIFGPWCNFQGRVQGDDSRYSLLIMFVSGEQSNESPELELRFLIDGNLEGPIFMHMDSTSPPRDKVGSYVILNGADRFLKLISNAK